jgi:formate dehydrogenase subunit gamma
MKDTRRFPRFDRAERMIHWANATLFLILLFTGASLYVGPLSTFVGHRHAVKTVHVYAGLLLPIPVLLGLLLPAGRQFRRDLRRVNRWSDDDRRWWLPSFHGRAQLGKFNPGQKLNAIFIGAAIVVMLATGSIMKWFDHFSDSQRTGATFVHDWTFLALCFVIAGHILFALSDFDSLRSMVRGWVPEKWARNERPLWWAELDAAMSARAGGDVEAGVDQRVGEAGVGAGEVAVGDAVHGGAADGVGGREL